MLRKTWDMTLYTNVLVSISSIIIISKINEQVKGLGQLKTTIPPMTEVMGFLTD